MKKFILLSIVSTLLFSMTATQIFATNENNSQIYIDTNNDSVCDNLSTNDSNKPIANSQNFVDTNNDGVCDNFATNNGNKQNNGNNKYNGKNTE